MANVVLVVAGGDPPEPEVLAALPEVDAVICADKGIEYALTNGWAIDTCVGDFDSVPLEVLTQVESTGVEILRFPTNKDQTDLALALDLACERAISKVIVVGVGGGRLDHLLGNITLLADPAFAEIDLTALVGTAKISVVHRSKTVNGSPGELVSLFAMNGDATGVTTEGMKYVLNDGTLHSGSSLGVSNEFTGNSAVVRVARGVVIVIQPDHLRPAEGHSSNV